MKIPFHKTYQLEGALPYIDQVLQEGNIGGDGSYTLKCEEQMMALLDVDQMMMMTSCTHALECALMTVLKETGGEVIIPSFAFPSLANAVLIAGGKPVFAPVERQHLNLDIDRIENYISEQTKAIIVIHYGGISCHMEKLVDLSRKYKLKIIEDCAQSFLSKDTQGRPLGSQGDFACFSFHNTKDVVCGEGGALRVSNMEDYKAARIIRQKGTDREGFIEGKVDFYQWQSKGSGYSPSELQMATLYSQLLKATPIVAKKQRIFDYYENFFIDNSFDCIESFSTKRKGIDHNGHLYYIIFKNKDSAKGFMEVMLQKGVDTRTHFVPLRTSAYGLKIIKECNRKNDYKYPSDFIWEDNLGQRLVRLPSFPHMTLDELDYIKDCLLEVLPLWT